MSYLLLFSSRLFFSLPPYLFFSFPHSAHPIHPQHTTPTSNLLATAYNDINTFICTSPISHLPSVNFACWTTHQVTLNKRNQYSTQQWSSRDNSIVALERRSMGFYSRAGMVPRRNCLFTSILCFCCCFFVCCSFCFLYWENINIVSNMARSLRHKWGDKVKDCYHVLIKRKNAIYHLMEEMFKIIFSILTENI